MKPPNHEKAPRGLQTANGAQDAAGGRKFNNVIPLKQPVRVCVACGGHHMRLAQLCDDCAAGSLAVAHISRAAEVLARTRHE